LKKTHNLIFIYSFIYFVICNLYTHDCYCREGRYDVYVDDTPLLEYKLAEVDSKCSIRFSGQEFGENFYSFGLTDKAIWLKVR